MSIQREYILKKKTLSEAVSKSLIKEPNIGRSKQEMKFLSELKGNMLYRKRKIDEFVKVTKMSNKRFFEMEESSTTSSEEKKALIKDRERKNFLKLDYRAVIDKRSKTQNKKRNPEISYNDKIQFHRNFVEFNRNSDHFDGFSRTVKEVEIFERRVNYNEGARAIYYSLLTHNPRIFDNFLKLINGKDKDYEMLLGKIYKECFEMEKSKLNLDYFLNKIKENPRKLFKSSSNFDMSLPNLNRLMCLQNKLKAKATEKSYPCKIEAIRKFSYNFNYKVKEFYVDEQKNINDRSLMTSNQHPL